MPKDLRINDEIRAREVLIINANGDKLGVMPLREAIRVAFDQNLDLVEVAPNAKPPVCRVMDYGKYKFEMAKRDRETKKKQKTAGMKEIRMRPNIEEHDFLVRLRNMQKFLREGDKVKATIMFRGREIVHADIGQALLRRMVEDCGDICAVERDPHLEGRHLIMILTPKQAQQQAE
ncbi:MAG TPA: translation initiation factor IF-3 [Bacillota bacterium]